jgi:hypothetical protein
MSGWLRFAGGVAVGLLGAFAISAGLVLFAMHPVFDAEAAP